MNIAKDFLLYSVGTVLVKLLLYAAVPVALYALPPDIMGLWSLCNGFIALGSIFVSLGLRQVFFIEYYHKTPYERRLMINEIILLYLSCSVPILMVLWQMRQCINTYFFASAAPGYLLASCFGACFISFFTELLYQVLLYSRKTILLIGIQLLGASITALGSLLALRYWHTGVVGLVGAQLVGLVFVSLCGLVLYFKKNVHHVPPVLSVKKVKDYLVNGLPFIPSVLAFWFLSSANRWILASFATLADVGTYACAEMVGMAFQMLVLYPLSGAYLPLVMEKFVHKGSPVKNDHVHIDSQNKKYMWLSMGALFIVGSVGFFVLKPFLYVLLPTAYQGIIPYLLLVGIGNIFLMGTYFASCYIQYHKKTFFLAGSLLFCAACNMIMSYFLVPVYGVGGCIIASTSAYSIYFGITYWYNNFLHAS